MASRIISPLWKGAKYSRSFASPKQSCIRCLITATAVQQKEKENFSINEILPPQDAFAQRHIGPRKEERKEMLKYLGMEVW